MRPRRIIAALASFAAASALAVDVYLGAWGGVGTWSGSGADRYWAYGVPYEWNTNDFVLIWNVPDTNAVAIPCRIGFTYNCRIFWGDNTSSEITAWNDADLTHSYAAAGSYTVAVTGSFPTIYFNNAGNKTNLLNVSNLGTCTSLDGSFFGCNNLTNVGGVADVSDVTSLNNTFMSCAALKGVEVSDWDVSKVTSMYATFYSCPALVTLDVSAWDVSSVTSFDSTFAGCGSLTNLDVSGWDVSKVTILYAMFYSCSSLKDLDVAAWNTTNFTDCRLTFYNCSSLTNLDVSAWDVSKVTSMFGMFQSCRALTNLDVASWVVTNVTEMGRLFQNCSALTSLDVSAWDVSGVTSMSEMFQGCSALTTLDIATWDVSSVANMAAMFDYMGSVVNLDVSTWDVSEVNNMVAMFRGATSLTNGLIPFLPLPLTTAQYMYDDDTKLVGDLAGVANLAVSNLYFGAQNCDAMTYSHSGGMLSSNIAHFFNFDMSAATLSSNEVTYILQDLDTSAATGGVVNVSGGTSQPPTYNGLVAKTNLTAKGWTVTTQ